MCCTKIYIFVEVDVIICITLINRFRFIELRLTIAFNLARFVRNA